jgi:hypothetical protein
LEGGVMEDTVKEFINDTSKKLTKIEKKIKEMKMNIVILSFYSDLSIIEDSILNYQAQGFEIDDKLLTKIDQFKILLHTKRDLRALGKKFIEVTEEFYKLRKHVQEVGETCEELIDIEKNKTKKKAEKTKEKGHSVEEYLYAYS